jgi:hypothetical protein
MLNKYKELHAKHIDLLVGYYNIHQEYIRKPTYERATLLRNVLSDLREIQKQMRAEIQVVRKQQEQINQSRYKENNNVSNNSSN